MYEDYADEDPQLVLRRPMKLTTAKPAPQGAERATPSTPVLKAGFLTNDEGAAVSVPKVQDISDSGTSPESITVKQEYVNKLVQSLGSLRSAVVSRRTPPVLNERSLR